MRVGMLVDERDVMKVEMTVFLLVAVMVDLKVVLKAAKWVG